MNEEKLNPMLGYDKEQEKPKPTKIKLPKLKKKNEATV